MQRFVAALARVHRAEGFAPLLIEPLAGFLPGNADNHAPANADLPPALAAAAEAGRPNTGRSNQGGHLNPLYFAPGRSNVGRR